MKKGILLCLLTLAGFFGTFAQTAWKNITETPDLTAVCFNGIFVAAGEKGRIQTSVDGQTWTPRTSGTTFNLFRVKYASGLFVTVGENGTILTSPDGTNWTVRTSPTTKTLYGVTFAAGLFVVVGDGVVLTSSNGTAWTQNASPPPEILIDVAFGNGLFVATAMSGAVRTSPDGVTWTTRTTGASQFLYSILYQNGFFVAVGAAGAIVTSPDGVTWTSRASGTTTALLGLTFGSGVYIAGNQDGTFLRSADGVNWTAQGTASSHFCYGVAFGADRFSAVSSGGYSFTSADGQTWQARQDGFSAQGLTLTDLAYGGQFTGRSNGSMVNSPDGISWTRQAGFDNTFVGGIAYDNTNHLYGVTANGNVVQATAGNTWGSPLNISGNALYDLAWGNGLFLIGAGYGTAYAGLGNSWTTLTAPGGSLAALSVVEYLNGQFVILGTYAGNTTQILSSANGTTLATKGVVSENLTGIAFGNGIYAAVGRQGGIYTSTDLITWQPRTSGTAESLFSVCFGYGRFVAVGNNGVVLVSADGSSWTPQTSHTTQPLYKVAVGNQSFVAVGTAVILQAPADNPLPVTLVRFKGVKQGRSVTLSWATASEVNSSRFEVERSPDAEKWTAVGRIAARGGAAWQVTDYSFSDPAPGGGPNFYRLKMIDNDGTFARSPVVSVVFDSPEVVLFPNPASGQVHISGIEQGATITLSDMAGRLLQAFSGKAIRTLDIRNYPAGSYRVQITLEDGTQYTRKVSIY